MAQQGNQLDSVKFSCSICLDLLKDPVTIPCGHNYCMDCIKTCWDEEDHRGVHSCPLCRETFTLRPVLVRNSMLAELVEDLKKTGLQAAPVDYCYAGPEDVTCDLCTGRKVKAVQSCLVCLVSYCEKHLQPHYDVAQLKKHKLVDPSNKLQENICSRHDEVMKIFCRTDQQSICYLCTMDEHKGHETVAAAAERCEKQKELEVSRQQIQQRIQDREKDIEMLQQEVEDINVSADKAVEDSEKTFDEVKRLLQKRNSDVKQQVRSQQEHEVSRVKDLQEKLQQEITDLKRREAELEKLSHTEDHNQFLHNYPSPSPLSGSTHSSSIQIRPLRYFEDVTAAVSETRDKLQDLLRETWTNISLSVAEVDVLLSEPKPKTRDKLQDLLGAKVTTTPLSVAEVDVSVSSGEPDARAGFLKYSRKINLDPNTANPYLQLSEGNTRATMMREKEYYPIHQDRFTRRWQVLSRQRLNARCYWEVEWSGGGGGGIEVAVAYDDISRAGNSDDCVFGLNDMSWTLICNATSYTFCHDGIETPVLGPPSSRIGVYLDHRAGILSFYSVSETMTLLHTVQTTFTDLLYAGLWLSRSSGTTAKILHIK
ncbi:tripartite motif-containing protein 16-like [Cololabis saira]|uniref:tripartite motif-containing protein 16-like n=1 Tax=Cololabis saira TaxID=129043 RepID=UPI002AD40FE6|nr:tripartite motif-containing protein 16-like [Cololabis saira]